MRIGDCKMVFKKIYSFLKNFWDKPKPVDLLSLDVVYSNFEDLSPMIDEYLKFNKLGCVDFDKSTSSTLIVYFNINTTLEQIALFEREWYLFGHIDDIIVNSDNQIRFQFEKLK